MATRKTLIVAKYSELEVELRKDLSADLFPSLDSVDIVDLVYLITMTFLGVDIEPANDAKIRELLDAHGVGLDAATFAGVAPRIREFVAWLKQL